MAKHILFLLKSGFNDGDKGPFFCPECAEVEGFLKYAPNVESQLDVRRIDFPRPRKPIIELLGEANQGCPVLVIEGGSDLPAEAKKSEETGKAFIAGGMQICEFLGRTFSTVRPH